MDNLYGLIKPIMGEIKRFESELPLTLKPGLGDLEKAVVTSVKENQKVLLNSQVGPMLTIGGIINALKELDDFENELKSIFKLANTVELGKKSLLGLLRNREEKLRNELNNKNLSFLDSLDAILNERNEINQTIR